MPAREAPPAQWSSTTPRPISGSRVEPEAHPAHGHEVPWIGGVELDLGSKTPHVRVERPRIDEILVPPQLIDALLPGDNPTGLAHEQRQEVELLARDVYRPTVDADLPTGGIEAHASA